MSPLHAAALLLALGAASACPSSTWLPHASCEMTATFADDCAIVQAEMTARISGSQEGSWTDPHNSGTYTVTSSTSSFMEAQRTTGDGSYTDKLDFSFGASGGGCAVTACSESQVFSISDFGTNYCNLHDLWCNSADSCAGVGGDLSYSESVGSCTDSDSSKCFPSSNTW